MQCVLNFKSHELGEVRKFLKMHPKLDTGDQNIDARASLEGCTVTLYASGKLLIQGRDAEKVKDTILAELVFEDEKSAGIDEVGRGERNGPFVIAGILGQTHKMRELRDSKKTSDIGPKKATVDRNALASVAVSFNAAYIDELREKGVNLNKMEELAIKKIAELFEGLEKNVEIVADGNRIGDLPKRIKFFPKADDKDPVVGAASVYAKWLRDNSSDKKERLSWK